jgi:hypothetical protein
MQKVEITRIANGHGNQRQPDADVETTVCIAASCQAKGTA